MADKYLDYDGLDHLIDLIKGAIAGAGSDVTADEVTVTVSDEGVISIKALGVGTAQLADASVTTAKLADGAVTIDQIDLSTVTPDAIGAAAAEHVHDAADITTGTLPVERGGTGVTSVDAGFAQYVQAYYVADKQELLDYIFGTS